MEVHQDRLQKSEFIIKSKARKLCCCRGFNRSDANDIAQELRLHVWQQESAFNPKRGSWECFVTVIVDRKAISLLRERRAEKRDPRREACSLNEQVTDCDGRTVERHQITERAAREWRRLHELKRDVADIRELLPEQYRLVIDELARGKTVNAIVSDNNISRRAAERCVEDLRAFFSEGYLHECL